MQTIVLNGHFAEHRAGHDVKSENAKTQHTNIQKYIVRCDKQWNC